MPSTNTPTIYYVVDSLGWVQHKRAQYYQTYLPQYPLKVLSKKQFLWRWKAGMLRKRPIYFSTWRILHPFLKKKSFLFQEKHLQYFMTSVTSHMNIGGGLKPELAIPNRTPEEAIKIAAQMLRQYKTVTANSQTLYDFLSPHLDNLAYCPNGVDETFYYPVEKTYNPTNITLGWTGTHRASKNYDVIKEAFEALEKLGFQTKTILISKGDSKVYTPEEMRSFFQSLDFYVCTSWNEGTPNPGLEAAACGVPVITTRVGNMIELIQPQVNGFFVEPNVDSVLNTCRKLSNLTDETYQQMRLEVRNHIMESWCWKNQIQRYQPLFEALLS